MWASFSQGHNSPPGSRHERCRSQFTDWFWDFWIRQGPLPWKRGSVFPRSGLFTISSFDDISSCPVGSSLNPNQNLSCTREIFRPGRMGSISSAAFCSPTVRRSHIHPETTAGVPAVETDYLLNTTPVGIKPVSRYRHKAITSFRASPMMVILRILPVNEPPRELYHWASSLSG